MKIIVTGSEGFLGKHLVEYLKKQDHKVIEWDIVKGKDVCDDLNENNIGAVFHLACPVNPGNFEKITIPTLLTSSIGTYHMLKIAETNKAKFLYVSSSEIYGELDSFPYKETDNPIININNRRAYYAISKLFGERITKEYYYNGLNARMIRPFNIYGPGMRNTDSRVIPSFMRKKKDNLPLEVLDGGRTKRTFCYITDFIDGIYKAMFSPQTNGGIFNLGSIEEVSMFELAKMISPNIDVVKKARTGEPQRRIPDISLAKKILHWQPTTNLQEGLALTWKSYQ